MNHHKTYLKPVAAIMYSKGNSMGACQILANFLPTDIEQNAEVCSSTILPIQIESNGTNCQIIVL